ncbi:MAG TPA: glycosyltransferase family 4 protein [Candidatus Polarisedimenticolaceae bacterium]|nr:glycosyltransferase family 4 protein [Candidatus Polarisedimenticolaceae bacterium]
MRVVYVSQYFPPEMGAPAARVHELAKSWVRAGHEVTVLTAFPHHPLGIKAKGDRGVITRRERIDGIDVLRTYVWAAANKGTVPRMLSYASFAASAAAIGPWRIRRPDVVIATSPQLLCGAAGFALARMLGAPFVFEVRDLWPETITAIDALPDSFVVRRLRGLSRFLYEHADAIVTVGEGYQRKIVELYGIDPAKIEIVHNGIDTSLFVPGPRDNDVRREFGWGDRFVMLYLGTHGMCHGLDRVVEAAHALRDRDEFRFVFVGEGAEKDALKAQTRRLSLGNVDFIGQQPKARVLQFYAACDLGLVTLRDTPLFQEVLPSKIFEYLGMERPILVSVDGEARRLVESSGGGRFVPPENVPAMVDAILAAHRDREQLAVGAREARRFVLAHFDRDRLAERYLGILGRCAA